MKESSDTVKNTSKAVEFLANTNYFQPSRGSRFYKEHISRFEYDAVLETLHFTLKSRGCAVSTLHKRLKKQDILKVTYCPGGRNKIENLHLTVHHGVVIHLKSNSFTSPGSLEGANNLIQQFKGSAGDKEGSMEVLNKNAYDVKSNGLASDNSSLSSSVNESFKSVMNGKKLRKSDIDLQSLRSKIASHISLNNGKIDTNGPCNTSEIGLISKKEEVNGGTGQKLPIPLTNVKILGAKSSTEENVPQKSRDVLKNGIKVTPQVKKILFTQRDSASSKENDENLQTPQKKTLGVKRNLISQSQPTFTPVIQSKKTLDITVISSSENGHTDENESPPSKKVSPETRPATPFFTKTRNSSSSSVTSTELTSKSSKLSSVTRSVKNGESSPTTSTSRFYGQSPKISLNKRTYGSGPEKTLGNSEAKYRWPSQLNNTPKKPSLSDAYKSLSTSASPKKRKLSESSEDNIKDTPTRSKLPEASVILSPIKLKQPQVEETSCRESSSLGFVNLGNTCYMNSVLQAIFWQDEFMSELKKVVERNSLPEDNLLRHLCLLYAIRNKDDKEEKQERLKLIKDNISRDNDAFIGDDQQDAHEFLMELFRRLGDELGSVTEEGSPNLLTKMFQTQLSVLRVCKECSKSKTASDVLTVLTVPIPKEKPVNIQAAVNHYFKLEEIESTCESCQCKFATDEPRIEKLPRYLVVHLKRYIFTSEVRKCEDSVTITKYLSLKSLLHQGATVQSSDQKDASERSTSILNDDNKENNPHSQSFGKEFSLEEEEPESSPWCYRLTSVVSHEGTDNQGHYVCDTFYPMGDRANTFNDNNVTEDIRADSLLEERKAIGYLFFYTQNC